MKNSFKMIPVLAGMGLALLGSINEVEASANDNSGAFTGDCIGSGQCGISSGGTLLIGKWHED